MTRGTIYYDATCGICSAGRRWWERTVVRRGFTLEPLQSDAARDVLGLAPGTLPSELKLRTPDGRILGGIEALGYVSRFVWWATSLHWLTRVPGARPVLDRLYRALARNRHRVSRVCGLTPEGDPSPFCPGCSVTTELTDNTDGLRGRDLVPVALLTAAALAVGPVLPAWAFMWVLAAAVFFGFKLLTLTGGRRRVATTGGRAIGFLLAWPGMDAGRFLDPMRGAERPARHEWLAATVKFAPGIALVAYAASAAATAPALLAGWAGMIGLILALHFGLFHLLSCAWRTAGVDARPLMDRPTRATSVAEFWGRRWNRGFHDLSVNLVFRPLRRPLGPAPALLAAFVASGLVHDLVISLPAGAGFGLPTAYFALQGLAVLFERSATGRALGLRRGRRGWLYTLLVTAGPAFWLFHPPFVHGVIVPFLAAIGSIATEAAMRVSLDTVLWLCGLLHLGILVASALVPGVLEWKRELARLSPLTRQLIWVHGAFIVMVIIAFAIISLLVPGDLASGSPLARAFCGFVAIFWLARLGVQFLVFDAGPLLTTPLLRLGYHGLTVVFVTLTLCYGWAAVAPAGVP